MNKKIKEFCKKYGITEAQFFGKEEIGGYLDLRSVAELPEGFNPTVGGSLYLRSVAELPEGFNPTVGGYLDLSSVTELPEGFNPTVGGYLDLSSVTELPEGFNPTVGGGLDLRSVTELPEGFNPTVGGYLDLSSVAELPEGFNPTVGGDLYLRSVAELPEGFNPTVGGYLDLRSVAELPEGFNPTVGGYLDLSSVTELPEGFNPTVGGSLYLRSVAELPEGFNPTVGGSLYLSSVTELPEGFNPTVGYWLFGKNRNKHIGADVVIPNIPEPELEWHNGKYVSIDGIFCEVINKKQQGKQIIRKCRKVNSDKKFFIVSIDGVHAHGDTIKEARDSFIYKISKRDTSEYKGLTLKSKVSFADAIKMYRVITGACEAGTRMFVESLPKADVKKTYTVAEMIALTKGQYGAETFAQFFKEEK